jgi:hypothetical protein
MLLLLRPDAAAGACCCWGLLLLGADAGGFILEALQGLSGAPASNMISSTARSTNNTAPAIRTSQLHITPTPAAPPPAPRLTCFSSSLLRSRSPSSGS